MNGRGFLALVALLALARLLAFAPGVLPLAALGLHPCPARLARFRFLCKHKLRSVKPRVRSSNVRAYIVIGLLEKLFPDDLKVLSNIGKLIAQLRDDGILVTQ